MLDLMLYPALVGLAISLVSAMIIGPQKAQTNPGGAIFAGAFQVYASGGHSILFVALGALMGFGGWLLFLAYCKKMGL